MRSSLFALVPLVLAAAAPAAAQEVFAGLYDHDVDLGVTVSGYEPGADVQLGWRGAPIEAFERVGAPRAQLFVSANTANASNFAVAGLVWRFPLGERAYFGPGIGLAAVDYRRGRTDRIDYGSAVVFAPELNLGWRASERWAVEASWVHLSHAQIFGEQNPGMDALGLRVVYRLGPN